MTLGIKYDDLSYIWGPTSRCREPIFANYSLTFTDILWYMCPPNPHMKKWIKYNNKQAKRISMTREMNILDIYSEIERTNSVLQSIYCSVRGPKFSSWYPHTWLLITTSKHSGCRVSDNFFYYPQTPTFCVINSCTHKETYIWIR